MRTPPLFLAAFLFFATASAIAAPKLYFTPKEVNGGLSFTDYGSNQFTEAVVNAFGAGNVFEIPTFENTATFSDASALFINARSQTSALSAAERTNILNFLTAGGAVFFVGDHTGWTSWDNSFLGLFGDHVEAWNSPSSAVSATSGVPDAFPDSITYMQAPGKIVGSNGNALYTQGLLTMASVYGPYDNAIAFLDTTPFGNVDLRRYETIGLGVGAWLFEKASDYEALRATPPDSGNNVPEGGVTSGLIAAVAALIAFHRIRRRTV